MGKTRALITIVCVNGTVYFNDTDYASTFTQALVASLGRTAGTLDPLVSSVVDDRLALIAPAVEAQVRQGLATKSSPHTAAGLVKPDTKLRRDAALHQGFDDPLPMSRQPSRTLRAAARGPRRRPKSGSISSISTSTNVSSDIKSDTGTSSDTCH